MVQGVFELAYLGEIVDLYWVDRLVFWLVAGVFRLVASVFGLVASVFGLVGLQRLNVILCFQDYSLWVMNISAIITQHKLRAKTRSDLTISLLCWMVVFRQKLLSLFQNTISHRQMADCWLLIPRIRNDSLVACRRIRHITKRHLILILNRLT